jgi:putative colanic acid biosynthesis acetyltransferase WcaF
MLARRTTLNSSNPERPYLGMGCTSPYHRRETFLRWMWLVVERTVFRWSPRPLHAWRALLLRCFGANIEDLRSVVVFPTVTVHFPWKLTLGRRSMLGHHVRVYNIAPVRLGYGANISQYTYLCAGGHDYSQWQLPTTFGPIAIGDNAWVAADVFVGPDVEIGEFAVIGARSVVITSMPARKVCLGHPCRPVKDRSEPV